VADELQLLQRITDDLPGDWTYKPSTVNDVDSVRFFQKTRVFTLQHFIRLLVARHRFEELLGELSRGKATGSPEAWGQGTGSFEATEREILQQITQCECAAGRGVGCDAARLGYAAERGGPLTWLRWAIGCGFLFFARAAALGIIGTYSVIYSRGRLGFFGAHAVSRLEADGVSVSLTRPNGS
jgi:hypothetical protein